MKKTLALLVLLALPSLAQTSPKRQPFPDDYKPSPCAAGAESICRSFDKARIVDAAKTFRGYELHSEWVSAHYDELAAAFMPYCTKIGNCFTIPDNGWVYCVDVLREDFLATCERYPAGSYDRDQCTQFAMTYFLGLGSKKTEYEQAQACVKSQPPAPGERTLEVFITPEKLDVNFDGTIMVYAYDAETRIPVRANIEVETGKLRSGEGPIARTGYKNTWTAKLKPVPNAEGHQDAAAPLLTVTAPGYKPFQLAMPVEIPRLAVEMTPVTLKAGKNTFTVHVRDAATGRPVWARVMADQMAIGESNKPIELELTKQDKRPEIWVTTLDNRYSDVVVLKRD